MEIRRYWWQDWKHFDFDGVAIGYKVKTLTDIRIFGTYHISKDAISRDVKQISKDASKLWMYNLMYSHCEDMTNMYNAWHEWIDVESTDTVDEKIQRSEK